MNGTLGGNRALDMLDSAEPFEFAEGRVDDEELLAGNDSGEQDRHALAVLAARVIESNQRAAADRVPALGRNGDVGTAADVCNGTHVAVPSWSVIVMVDVTLTKRARTTNSGSSSFSPGGYQLAATMAAPGDPSMKHEKSAKLA